MGIITDWISSLLSKSSTDSASERQSKANQGCPDGENHNDLGKKAELPPDIKEQLDSIRAKLIELKASGIHLKPYSESELRSMAKQGDPDEEGLYDLGKNVELPVFKLVNYLLAEAIRRRASKIHIESNEDSFWISYRIDGIFKLMMVPPKRLQDYMIDRVKIMAKLDIAEKRLPQVGMISVRVSGRIFDLRFSTVPASYGEKVVIRIRNPAEVHAEPAEKESEKGLNPIEIRQREDR